MMGHLAYQAAIEHMNSLRAMADGRRAGGVTHRDRPRRRRARLWLRARRLPRPKAV